MAEPAGVLGTVQPVVKHHRREAGLLDALLMTTLP